MKALSIISVLISLTIALTAVGETKTVHDFALIDHRGGFHQLSQYANRDAAVIFVQGNGCDISRQASAVLNDIQNHFSSNTIEILMLNAKHDDDRASIQAEAEKFAISFPIMIDQTQLVAESLAITTTGEALLIKPSTLELVYRGPINAKIDGVTVEFLQDALSNLLAGQSSNLNPPAVAGKALQFPRLAQHQKTTPSYQKDIVPILQERCVACHQENGLAPWAMNSYQMIQGWAPMIRETVMTKRMPPGQIDTFNLEQFVDIHHITPQEQTTLIHWINAGAPMQGKNDPLTKISASDDTWALGKPDLIVDVPPQDVPATGVIEYRYIPVDIGLTENKWLRGYEFKVGAKSVLHHIIAFTEDSANPGPRQLMGGFGPGKEPRHLPDEAGFLLTPTTQFVMQIHYTTNGQATVDNTQLALYLSDEEPKYQFRNDQAVNFRFAIPPHAQDFPSSAELVLKKDALIYSFSPHMHFRGKRMDYTAIYPDGKKEWLINIPNYRFDWQMDYKLKEPKLLPAGTKIVANGAFDNSEMNAFNPDPSKEVRWGDQTWEEMFIGFVGMAYADGE